MKPPFAPAGFSVHFSGGHGHGHGDHDDDTLDHAPKIIYVNGTIDLNVDDYLAGAGAELAVA